MPVYEYKGLDTAGKNVKGMIDAESKAALRQMLQSKGIFVTDVAEGRSASAGGEVDLKRRLQRVSLRDISVLTRQLSTLMRAGIPLVESLAALTEQAEKDELKRVLSDVKRQVNEGSSLAKALEQHPKQFSDLYVNMVKAGESSGNLDVVLERLTEFLDNQMELRSKIISAMIYPILMTLVGSAIMVFLFIFVIPKVTQIFEEQERALPAATRLLLFMSGTLGSYWFIIIPAIIAAAFGFRHWKNTPAGRAKWDAFVLKLPVISGIVRMIAVARFSRTLSTLLLSGVPLLQALDIVKNILGNTKLIAVIEDVRINVREGESLAQPLRRSGEFPPLVSHMISIGERTGQLEEMLENVAQSYNQQVNMRIDAATTLLEPMMIIIMGVSVAFIVFAIMMPILQMNQP